MRACIYNLIAALFVVGCTADNMDKLAAGQQGLAEVHVDAAQLLAASITRVTLAAAGQTQDLTFNPATSTFDGSLILSSGSQTLVASAFSGDTLVGQSQPISVNVQSGVATRVMVRILELTTDTSVYGPIVDSLSFPTSITAGTQATFAISVVAPAGDPVTYSWTSDCVDATFLAPDAATTSWSKPAAGTCDITVAATSNGFTVVQSFGIVVFPPGSTNGGVLVNSVFVSAPRLALSLPDVNCSLPNSNASCPKAIASPSTSSYSVSVFDWGSFSTAGTIEITDNCGGRFGTAFRQVGFVIGNWLPPVSSGICILTARAVNGGGVASTLSAAILVHAGSAPTPTQPPSFSFGGFMFNNTFFSFSDASSPTNVGQIPPGTSVFVEGSLDWRDGLPGTLVITDDCAGAQPDPGTANPFQGAPWSVPDLQGRTCTVTMQATNLQGRTGSAVAIQYMIAGP